MYLCDRDKEETGFSDVVSGLDPRSPFGKKLAAELSPFMPGEEARLELELGRVQAACDTLVAKPGETKRAREIFGGMKDISLTLMQCGGRVLSTVELFEVKALLLGMEALRELCGDIGEIMPEGFTPEDTGGLLDALDPEGGRMPVFYIYDMFSGRLAELRREKKDRERLLRAGQKRLAA